MNQVNTLVDLQPLGAIRRLRSEARSGGLAGFTDHGPNSSMCDRPFCILGVTSILKLSCKKLQNSLLLDASCSTPRHCPKLSEPRARRCRGDGKSGLGSFQQSLGCQVSAEPQFFLVALVRGRGRDRTGTGLLQLLTEGNYGVQGKV